MTARSPTRSRHRSKPNQGFLGRMLDPIDRLSETIYSVLILLTFTLAFRVILHNAYPATIIAEDYADELIVTAFGAILAWGLIDGLMYALMELFQRGERHRLLQQIQSAPSEQDALDAIAEEFDYILEPIAGEAERQALYRNVHIQLRTSEPRPVGLRREDFSGALGCVVVSLLAVLPSFAPLVLFRDNLELGIRISNLVSFVVLFSAGYSWGRHTGANPWRTGLLLVAAAALMVAIALPLGG